MIYVAKNLPAWVRFRKRALVREAYGPPTAMEAATRRMVEAYARNQLLRLQRPNTLVAFLSEKGVRHD